MDKRIENIKKHEHQLDAMETFISTLESLLEQWKSLQPGFKELMDYYSSPQWQNDVESENQGEFKDLKCGVLSQDGIYNLYHRQRELSLELIRTALDTIE